MSASVLYTYPASFRASKVLIAAQYSGFNVKTSDDFVFGETNKSSAFLQKFPLGKVPALETPENKYVVESNAIAHYVGNEQLRGSNLLDQSHILQWINFADSEIVPAACSWLFPTLALMPYNKQSTERAKEDIKKALEILNNHLLSRTFLVGERITQADISTFCSLFGLYQNLLEPSFRQPFPNVNRWFITLLHQPQFKTVLGDVTLCEKMAQYDPKKYAELHKKTGKDKSVKGAENEKKKAKPQEVKDVDDQPDETELILAQESKKDPFQKFPKGSFNMDDFKRVYSNEDESVSIKYFWEKFDKENFSIWYCEYLYPQELTLVFMSCNLISGMFQRLDKMRKNAFGSVCLFGEDNNSTISGIWFWKGHELAFELSEDWQIDYESYSWKKLDASSAETKKIVNEYLSWSGDFGGKKFNQGKIFK